MPLLIPEPNLTVWQAAKVSDFVPMTTLLLLREKRINVVIGWIGKEALICILMLWPKLPV